MYQHATASRTLVLHASADDAFPMFGPFGERAWAGPRWNPHVLWADGAGDREGMVFRNADDPQTWVNLRFDPQGRVAEYLHFDDKVVTRIRVTLEPAGEQLTHALVAYEWVALSEEGNAVVEAKKAGAEEFLKWDEAINAALAAGAK